MEIITIIIGIILGLGLIFHTMDALWEGESQILGVFFGFFIPGQKYRKFKRYAKKWNAPEFTFNQIKTFYTTAPSKWEMGYNEDAVDWYKHHWELTYTPSKYADARHISVKTLFDFLLVKAFFKKMARANSKKEKNVAVSRNTAEMITFLKQDAANAQAEADKMIASQEKELKEIFSMLNKNTTATS